MVSADARLELEEEETSLKNGQTRLPTKKYRCRMEYLAPDVIVTGEREHGNYTWCDSNIIFSFFVYVRSAAKVVQQNRQRFAKKVCVWSFFFYEGGANSPPPLSP
eukprot:GEMP01113758.1.p1 GENE.GEMP01113758.1~~GEMP01113758.1.p1  ORF type:complete len:105 (+),score=10.52 GEMP01113758.1:81-395(+)